MDRRAPRLNGEIGQPGCGVRALGTRVALAYNGAMSSSPVSADVTYLVPGEGRPVYIASQAGADAALSIGAEFERRAVQVHDARELQPAPTLDREGFELVAHTPCVRDFYDLEPERGRYEQSLVSLVCDVTGAAHALVFDHTLRSDSREVRGDRVTRETAAVIHNDYTDASAERRLRDLLPADEAEKRLLRRYAIINVWRTVAGPVQRSPLALCDAHTLAPGDLVAAERRAVERVGELELVTYNPDHRWLYYPLVAPDEALLIKTFDSASDGRARRSIHTAFDDPQTPADAPPRESMESRLLVFF